MKQRLIKKFKHIQTFTSPKPGLSLHPNPTDKNPNQRCEIPTLSLETEISNFKLPFVESGGKSEHVNKVLKDEEIELEFSLSHKNNAHQEEAKLSYSTLQALEFTVKGKLEAPPLAFLSEFEEKCPPGGSQAVIFYTTSFRSIRKTFEECNSIRFLLESFKVLFYERDVSMHLEFREELWRILGGRVIPPRLFIKGRYIGGADEVVGLHEQGKLKELLEGIPINPFDSPCVNCANLRFVVCPNCNGSCRVFKHRHHDDHDDHDNLHMRCPQCNENGSCNGSCRVFKDRHHDDYDDDDNLHMRCPQCNENGLVKCFSCF